MTPEGERSTIGVRYAMRYLLAAALFAGCAATTPVTCDPDGYACRGTLLTGAQIDRVCHNGVGSDGMERVSTCLGGEAGCNVLGRDSMGLTYIQSQHAIVCDDSGALSLK